ncbi:hypothetical protein INR49_018185 [Caranx melampygus]|nr:hypothetical protein INR49_018185 [Caranx melampygus]
MSFFGLDCVRKKEREQERKLRANDREFNLPFKYATNAIKTSKYNLFTFLPLNLFEQFQRIANAYFLFLLVLQNRHRSDNHVNNRKAQVLIDRKLRSEKWMDVQVGDIIKLENNQFVTADLLLLSSSEPLNLVYIETAELDGETNLKVRQALPVTGDLGDNIEKLADFNGEVRCEPPNNRLDRFTGTLTYAGQKHPLDNEKILLRGCTLRNTEWCFGLVLFGGPETKLMQNCGKSTFKRTSIDRNWIWEMNEGSQFTVFLPRQDGNNAAFSAFLTFWSYVIILNTVVPISLYVRSSGWGTASTSRDVFDYAGQRLEITEHTETVDFSFNPLADPRFMFYDHALVEAVKLENPEVHAFFRLLALCHTVMAEEKKEGELFYQAQSPDEGALVTAARNFGFVFRSRTPDSVCIVEMGEQRSYELLAILDFNNVRKRMSVIVRSPEGKLSLYCKGADTIIYERLHQSCSKLMDVTTEHLNEFAGEGLRTLVLAYKDLDEEYFNQWQQRHHEASTTLDDREGKLDELYEEIEKDLLLLGATAIEDKLQDGVPQTIELLAKADINIWVLTGDKQETAENIGYSCNLLREEMTEVFIISGNSPEDVREELRNARTCMKPDAVDSAFLPARTLGKGVKALADEVVNGEYGLVINGHTAHIGVGISGQEGMQAVLSSDFSFAQFRFLQHLLLVHGRWSYLRMCKFLRYFFYKNFTFTFVHFWYAFFCGFSAQTVYDEWFITLYNLVYTALPVLGMSLFDQDVNCKYSFQYPQLYVPGQLNLYFSKKAFFKCAFHSCYSSLVLFFIPYAAMQDTVRDDGKDIADYQSFALLTQTCLLFAVSIQLGLEMSYWTSVNAFFVLGSLTMYFAVTFTMYSNGMFLMLPAAFPFIGTARNSLNQPNVWLTIFLTSTLCILPVVTYRFLLIQVCPTINDKVMFKVKRTKLAPSPPTRRTRMRRTSSRRSGYAFSHAQGYGDLVTSGRFLRRPAVTRSSGLNMGRTTTGFSPMGRSAGYSPTGRPQNVKAEDVVVTSLQMYRTIKDSNL